MAFTIPPFHYFASVVLVLVFGGCGTSPSPHWPEGDASLVPGESVAILVSREFPPEISQYKLVTRLIERMGENTIARSVAAPIEDAYPGLEIMAPDEFRRIAYPDIETNGAPRDPGRLPRDLLNDSVFRERIASSTDLRYVILVKVQTTDGPTEARGVGGGGGGVPGGFGVIWWDRRSHVTASIHDLKKQGRDYVLLRAHDNGTVGFGVLLILPIPFWSYTESRACADLGAQIVEFLTDPAPVDQSSTGTSPDGQSLKGSRLIDQFLKGTRPIEP